ncbi:hypothetical protein IWZ00DRAFT_165597 [Phyllosticta capitalensis]
MTSSSSLSHVAVDFSASSASASPSPAAAPAGKTPPTSQLHDRTTPDSSQDLSSLSTNQTHHPYAVQAIAMASSSSTGTPSTTPATPATPASDAAGSSYWDAIDPDNDAYPDSCVDYVDDSFCNNTVSELDLNDVGDAGLYGYGDEDQEDEDDDDDAGWWDQLADDDEYWRDSTPAPTVAEVRCAA